MQPLIQGKNVVLAIKKDIYVPFVCASDFSVEVDAETVDVRTPNSGNWKKKSYQSLSWKMTLGGMLVYDTINWDGWEFLYNQFGLTSIDVQATFIDDAGTARSLRGTVMISASVLSATIGDAVKGTFSLEGNGKIDIFDGFVPCPSSVTSITVDGQTAADGIVHIDYTFSGDLAQIKYRLDGVGDYVYALPDTVLSIPGLSLGSHSIEIIPICNNAFEGTGMTQPFMVTQSLTCDSQITNITIAAGPPMTATAVHTGSATQMAYTIDGNPPTRIVPISQAISLSGLSVGNHFISMIPICSNNLQGTGFEKPFTITSNSSQSVLNYSYTQDPSITYLMGEKFYIYIDSVLAVVLTASGSGTLNIGVGQSVRTYLVGLGHYQNTKTLTIEDQTTSTIIYNTTITTSTPGIPQHTFVANGDNYLITANVIAGI